MTTHAVPCGICLGEFEDEAFLSGCMHTFCFTCIGEWAKQATCCPMCKKPFVRIAKKSAAAAPPKRTPRTTKDVIIVTGQRVLESDDDNEDDDSASDASVVGYGGRHRRDFDMIDDEDEYDLTDGFVVADDEDDEEEGDDDDEDEEEEEEAEESDNDNDDDGDGSSESSEFKPKRKTLHKRSADDSASDDVEIVRVVAPAKRQRTVNSPV